MTPEQLEFEWPAPQLIEDNGDVYLPQKSMMFDRWIVVKRETVNDFPTEEEARAEAVRLNKELADCDGE